ncbi:MAG TPA: hypothetical protein DEA08_21620 [Planctomycetes bacterium]|nr:hypothetical protein [Planctomycetota bacterium]
MTSLLTIVEDLARTSAAEDPWRDLMGRTEEVGAAVAEALKALLQGTEGPDSEHSYEEIVGLAAGLMLKFRVHAEPVWSSRALEQHMERFFQIPGATERALWEGMARVLPSELSEVAANLCDTLNRLLRFERSEPITQADIAHLVPFARERRSFWYPLLWLSTRADATTPELMAEALVGLGAGVPRERCLQGLRDRLAQPEYRSACLAHAKTLPTGSADELESALGEITAP